jgi:hypothetical protein
MQQAIAKARQEASSKAVTAAGQASQQLPAPLQLPPTMAAAQPSLARAASGRLSDQPASAPKASQGTSAKVTADKGSLTRKEHSNPQAVTRPKPPEPVARLKGTVQSISGDSSNNTEIIVAAMVNRTSIYVCLVVYHVCHMSVMIIDVLCWYVQSRSEH